jgi:hypothetical protein
MPVGKPKTSVVECRTGVKDAATEYGAACSETAAMEHWPATSEAAAMERRASAVEPTTMEAAAATVETSSAVPSATTVASATSATTDLSYRYPRGGFGDRCCARTEQRHRLGALARCGR